MNELGDLGKQVQAALMEATAKASAAREDALKDIILELNQSIGDLVSKLEQERPAPVVNVHPQIDVAPATLPAAQPAPVHVNVEPTPITVEATMPVPPAPVIHVMPSEHEPWTKLHVTINRDGGGKAESFTVERV